MADKTKIEWTDATWNPVTGCTPISDGCKYCYAKAMANRFSGGDFSVKLHPERLGTPLHWKKPRKVFVNSVSDTFHEDVPPEFVDRMWEVMAACPQHTFQVLTKRPENIKEKLYGVTPECPCRELGGGDYLPNVWLGVTVESPRYIDRIDHLMQCLAAVRFLSLEPLLGPMDLFPLLGEERYGDCGGCKASPINGLPYCSCDHPMGGIDWLIIGCESGPNRRKCKLEWVRDIVDQCQAASAPVFVKQLNINGKVVKDINQFPLELQIRQWPGRS